jgi:DNA-binding NarL/FixJ family response regulator
MEAIQTVSSPMSEQPGAPVRVMIVEDDAGMLDRFAAALVRDPRTRVVEKVRTGKEAIARLLLVTPDVLLVDLGLPDVHGTEVIRFAARNLPECDIMVVTVFGDERNVVASIESGATGYVLKDCSDADLITRILELRAGGSPMSPGIARIVLNQMRAGTAAAPGPARRGAGESASSALTARETDVLRLLSRGYTYSEVGDRLGISLHTVTSHIKNSYRKLAVRTGAAAVTRAAELGLLRPGGNKPGGV